MSWLQHGSDCGFWFVGFLNSAAAVFEETVWSLLRVAVVPFRVFSSKIPIFLCREEKRNNADLSRSYALSVPVLGNCKRVQSLKSLARSGLPTSASDCVVTTVSQASKLFCFPLYCSWNKTKTCSNSCGLCRVLKEKCLCSVYNSNTHLHKTLG